MGAALRDQAQLARRRVIQRQVLAQQLDRQNRLAVELGQRGHRVPVATQQSAHRGAGPDPRQTIVGFLREHGLEVSVES